jgi:hypothetical protein
MTAGAVSSITTTRRVCVFLPRRSAYVRRPRLARVNDASEKKLRVATVDPYGRAPPAHHPSIAHCPVDGVFKKNIGGEGEA